MEVKEMKKPRVLIASGKKKKNQSSLYQKNKQVFKMLDFFKMLIICHSSAQGIKNKWVGDGSTEDSKRQFERQKTGLVLVSVFSGQVVQTQPPV